MKFSIVVLLVQTVLVCQPYRLRPHRRYGSSYISSDDSIEEVFNDHPIKTPPCDLLCMAQWKSDFQVTFQKIYDRSYIESPLDSIILGTKSSLNSFCSITEQKFQCFTRECGMTKIDWSPDKFICMDNLKRFQDNNKCLNRTASIVRKQCIDVCNNIQSSLIDTEKKYITNLGLSQNVFSRFVEQNKFCHVLSCHQICHEQTIMNVCVEGEREPARDLIRDYYDAIFLREWKEKQNSKTEELYSSFCRRSTPMLDENKYVSHMSHHNNRFLERIKTDVKAMLAEL